MVLYESWRHSALRGASGMSADTYEIWRLRHHKKGDVEMFNTTDIPKSSRIPKLVEALYAHMPVIESARAKLITESYKATEGQPTITRRAEAFAHILRNIPIIIRDNELIVGSSTIAPRGCQTFPEFSYQWLEDELDTVETRSADPFYIAEETKQELREVHKYWKGKTSSELATSYMAPEAIRAIEHNIFTPGNYFYNGVGHVTVKYEEVLAIGYKGIIDKAQAELDRCQVGDGNYVKKSHFLKAVILSCQAVIEYAERYAELASQMAAECTDPVRKQELLQISQNCSRVPANGATSFYEACQSFWFVQQLLQVESSGHSISPGRFDQYMYPYYIKDINEKKITEEEALELLTCLWIKTLTVNKVRSQAHTLSSAGSPMYQNVTIGGQTTDKKDAVNELSFAVLKSVAQTRLTQPNLTVRYHANLNKHFFDECIEVMKLGFGMPALNNDEIIIPSFINWGVKEEDAYNYSAIGCVETAVPGKWGYRCTGMSYVNFPRVLLCTMNNGVDLTTNKRFTKGHGYFTEMETYEDLLAAWDKTVREMTRYSVIVENFIDKASERDVPDILCSALTDDCIGRGKTIKEGGAVYDFISGLQVGIANMANSLAAIKKLVYDEKKITREQLWNAILDDFQSPENKKIQEMLNDEAPKYGNDDDYADNLIVEAYDSYIDEIKKYPNTRYNRGPIGGIRYAGTSSISANVGQGMGTMATPDGRNAHEPLAEGCSPAHNTDKNGPTAVFKSISKLRTEKITGGVLLNQKMTPQMLSTEENKQKLELLIRTFFNRLHGYHVQYNIVSKETLIDAQKHPENHKDLIVRVAGYSAFFNVLSKATQDDIIGRTEQSL